METKKQKTKVTQMEEDVLKLWNKEDFFNKSLKKISKKGDFTFYDGPPFATGLPHYGHILASVLKDVVPRYKTMQGYHVPRVWGWDCHGLPVENLIEKDLELKTKKDIEDFGIGKFNQSAKDSVFIYRDEWKKIIPRIGRWVDMENDYRTLDASYMESVFWVFKELHQKGFVYKGHKSMHMCPRCETTLANFEVNQGYKDVTDISVTVKFELEDEPGTYILAWTTTPWTLSGNVALAVNPNIEYVRVGIRNQESGIKENYILAKNVFDSLYNRDDKDPLKLAFDLVYAHKNEKGFDSLILKEFKGKDLIGKKYKPVFDYYAKDETLENRENGWKIYGADFVTTEDGTGVVHIAPAFGEDDMNLGKENDLPFIQHVSPDGRFKKEVADFPGFSVKPKDNPQETDIEIIKWLAHNGKLFAKEKLVHSYPHCWRCDTPLLNYASSSWFVEVEKIKKKLLANNKKVSWTPDNIKDGRFGKWLEGARDWAVSRSRFWGAPLPVWECKECESFDVFGSVSDIAKRSKFNNKYSVMRHGEAEFNVKNIVASELTSSNKLTKKGIAQAEKSAGNLKDIDVIISSPFLRTKQTAEIAAKHLGFEKTDIVLEPLLKEIDTGIFHGKPVSEYHAYFNDGKEPKGKKEYHNSLLNKFEKRPPKGESLADLRKRMAKVVKKYEKKYKGKNILFVSHEYPIWILESTLLGLDNEKTAKRKSDMKHPDYIKTAEVRELPKGKFPLNENGELDLHRPYIDEVEMECKGCKNKMKRVEDVFDCWFESGSMPYAQAHYPFENKKKFEGSFPAEFIAEGLDQTRGWFYTLLVLSTALFDKPAYKNVIVNGIILAEDGQKMSKRLKNYPDPMEVVEKYGADSLRYYLLASPVVQAESLNFSEEGVNEIHKKIVMRLLNVLNFFETYVDKKDSGAKKPNSKNVLDRWILAEFDNTKKEVVEAMGKYELNRAVRPFDKFIDDLSTWYLRRSRDRFKNDGKDRDNAINTTRYVLIELSKILAPFMPFVSEEVYRKLNNNKGSVHLEDYPKVSKTTDKDIMKNMEDVRNVVSLALQKRAKAGVKVRQPLKKLSFKNEDLRMKDEFLELIGDEVNVKEVVFDKNIPDDVELDLNITPELKEEGMARDIIRAIQDERKSMKLVKEDFIKINFGESELLKNILSKFEDQIKKETITKEMSFVVELAAAKEMKLDDQMVGFEVEKL